MVAPSIVVVYCGIWLSSASAVRQSYSSRQYRRGQRRYPRGTPRFQPTPGNSSGHRWRYPPVQVVDIGLRDVYFEGLHG